ncbi:hypothetical protein BB558_005659 [Smittium angustum]|uniref:BHLH domain-containing protein n=1 Tax=Smittium angustum TaxID=133377 RepID=A0A2U1IZW9_SMIAN|nr:hypothetical protein BB558_005659 [Smittium angustum]
MEDNSYKQHLDSQLNLLDNQNLGMDDFSISEYPQKSEDSYNSKSFLECSIKADSIPNSGNSNYESKDTSIQHEIDINALQNEALGSLIFSNDRKSMEQMGNAQLLVDEIIDSNIQRCLSMGNSSIDINNFGIPDTNQLNFDRISDIQNFSQSSTAFSNPMLSKNKSSPLCFGIGMNEAGTSKVNNNFNQYHLNRMGLTDSQILKNESIQSGTFNPNQNFAKQYQNQNFYQQIRNGLQDDSRINQIVMENRMNLPIPTFHNQPNVNNSQGPYYQHRKAISSSGLNSYSFYSQLIPKIPNPENENSRKTKNKSYVGNVDKKDTNIDGTKRKSRPISVDLNLTKLPETSKLLSETNFNENKNGFGSIYSNETSVLNNNPNIYFGIGSNICMDNNGFDYASFLEKGDKILIDNLNSVNMPFPADKAMYIEENCSHNVGKNKLENVVIGRKKTKSSDFYQEHKPCNNNKENLLKMEGLSHRVDRQLAETTGTPIKFIRPERNTEQIRKKRKIDTIEHQLKKNDTIKTENFNNAIQDTQINSKTGDDTTEQPKSQQWQRLSEQRRRDAMRKNFDLLKRMLPEEYMKSDDGRELARPVLLARCK